MLIIHNYLAWNNIETTDFSDTHISELYASGHVLVRTSRGKLNQTRSLRVSLPDFEPNTENRRILRKVEDMSVEAVPLPVAEADYDWNIHKLGKDYFQRKFGPQVFSANKIKELLTDQQNSNFNLLLHYKSADKTVGYAICYVNSDMMHYAYPFYDLDAFPVNYGMGMMLQALLYAKEAGKQYLYIGSASRPADAYKLQFNSLQWFDGEQWNSDLEALKPLLQENSPQN